MLLALAAHAANYDVIVDDYGATPETLEISVGDRVNFVFLGSVAQSSTAAAGQADSWDSGLQHNVFWERAFDIAGTFTWYDQTLGSDDGYGLVSGVSGTIIVSGDSDGDGLSDADEALYHTDPTNPDTDGDTLTDGEEAGEFGYGTDPLLSDTDADNLGDADEVLVYGTDPFEPDTDRGGVLDGDEVGVTDPLDGTDDLPLSMLSIAIGPVQGTNVLVADNLAPGNTAVLYRAAQPGLTSRACGEPLRIKNARTSGTAVVAANGTATFTFDTSITGDRYFQVRERETCKRSSRLLVTW